MAHEHLPQHRQEHLRIFEQILRMRMERLALSYQDFQTRLEENIAGDLGLTSAVGTHEEAVARAENRKATSHSEQLENALQIMRGWQIVNATRLQIGLLDDDIIDTQDADEVAERVSATLQDEASKRIDALSVRDESKAALKEIYAQSLEKARGSAQSFARWFDETLQQAARAHRKETMAEPERNFLMLRLADNKLSMQMLMKAQTPAHILEYAVLQASLASNADNAKELRTVVQDYVRRGTPMNAFALRPDSDRIQYIQAKEGGAFQGPQAFIARRLWRAVENNLVTLADSSGQHLLENVYSYFEEMGEEARHFPEGMKELLRDDLLRAQMVTQALQPVAAWLGIPKDPDEWGLYREDIKNTQMRDILQDAGLYREGDQLPQWPSATGLHKLLQASFYKQITNLPSMRDAPKAGEYGYEQYHDAVLGLAGRFAASLTLQETTPVVSLEDMRIRPMSTAPDKRSNDTLFTKIFVGRKEGILTVEAAEEYSEEKVAKLLAMQDANMQQNFAQQMDETVQLWRKSGRDYTDSTLYKACAEAGIEITNGAQVVELATQADALQDVPMRTASIIRREARQMIVEHLAQVEKAEESQLAIPFGCTALDTAWQHMAQIPTEFIRRALVMQKLVLDTNTPVPELKSAPVVTPQEKQMLLAVCDAWDKKEIQAHDYCRFMFNFLVDNESANRKDIHTIIQDAHSKGFITDEQSKALDLQLGRADMQVGAHSLASALGFAINDMHGVFHAQQQGSPHHTVALTVLSCASLVNTTQAIRTLTHGEQTKDAPEKGASINLANAAMAGTTYTHGIKGRGQGASCLGIAIMSDKSANMFIRERLDEVSQKPRKYLSNAATHESAHIIDYSMGAAIAKYLNDTALDAAQPATVRMAAASIVHLMPSAARRTLPGTTPRDFVASAEKSIDTLAQAEVNSTTKVVNGAGDQKVERLVPNGAIMSGFAALPPDAWAVVTMLRQKLPQTEESAKLWDAADSMRRMFYKEETAFAEGAIDYLKAFKQENIKGSEDFKKDLQERYESALRPRLVTAGFPEAAAQSVASQIAANAAAKFATIPAKWADGRTMASKLLAATSQSEPDIWEASKVFRVALVAVLTKDGEHTSAKDRLQLLQRTTPKDVWRHVDTAMSGLAGIFAVDSTDKKVFGGLRAEEDDVKGASLRALISRNKPENAPPGFLKDALNGIVDAIQQASIEEFRKTFLRNERLMEPQVKPTEYLARELKSANRKYFANASELFARAVEHVTTEKYLAGHLKPDLVDLLRQHRNLLADPQAEVSGKRDTPKVKSALPTQSSTVGLSQTASASAAERISQAIVSMAPQGWDTNKFLQREAQGRVQQAIIAMMGGSTSEDYSLRTITHAAPQKTTTKADIDANQWAQDRQKANIALCQKVDAAIELVQAYQQLCQQGEPTKEARSRVGVTLHTLVSELEDNHTPLPLPANMLPLFTHYAHYPTLEMSAEAQLAKCVTAAFESANTIGGQALEQMLERNKENVLAENLQQSGDELSAAQHVRAARSAATQDALPEHSTEENARSAIYSCFDARQLSESYVGAVLPKIQAPTEPENEDESPAADLPELEPVDWGKAKQEGFDFDN